MATDDQTPQQGPWRAPWEGLPPCEKLPVGRDRKAAGAVRRNAWRQHREALRRALEQGNVAPPPKPGPEPPNKKAVGGGEA